MKLICNTQTHTHNPAQVRIFYTGTFCSVLCSLCTRWIGCSFLFFFFLYFYPLNSEWDTIFCFLFRKWPFCRWQSQHLSKLHICAQFYRVNKSIKFAQTNVIFCCFFFSPSIFKGWWPNGNRIACMNWTADGIKLLQTATKNKTNRKLSEFKLDNIGKCV